MASISDSFPTNHFALLIGSLSAVIMSSDEPSCSFICELLLTDIISSPLSIVDHIAALNQFWRFDLIVINVDPQLKDEFDRAQFHYMKLINDSKRLIDTIDMTAHKQLARNRFIRSVSNLQDAIIIQQSLAIAGKEMLIKAKQEREKKPNP